MPIWKRVKRAVRSLLGFAADKAISPKLALEQNIRELNGQVPEMNENIATVKANVLMLEKEVAASREDAEKFTLEIKAAISEGREDVAEQKAIRLEKEKERAERLSAQLGKAREAYEKALEVKKAFMQEKETKIREAKAALRAHEQAEWQSEIAGAMEQFEVGGLGQTHDEMIRRLGQETAESEARMELALDSVDEDQLQLEETAQSARASELVEEFKREMDSGAQKQLTEGSGERAPAKTIGRQKEKSK